MTEVDAIISVLDKLGQLSGVTLAAGILILFQRRIVRWGWEVDECQKKRDTYESLINENNAKTAALLAETQAKLAEYERAKAA